MCRTASTMFPEPASPLVRTIAAPSAILRSASPRFRAPQTNGTLYPCFHTWCASSAGVSTSLSSMYSTSSASSTCAWAKCPMRTLAITGIETVSIISRMMRGAAMRATPPSLRISEGTRSSAITAQAPASSAILACSAFVTSIIPPPFNISARPTFTRHKLLFISSIEFLPRSRLQISLLQRLPCQFLGRIGRHGLLRMAFRINDHKSPSAARQHPTRNIAYLADHKQISAGHFYFVPFDDQIRIYRNRFQILDGQFRRHRVHSAEPAYFPHHFIQHSSYDAAVNESRPTLIFRSEPEIPANAFRIIVLLERQQHPALIGTAAAKTKIRRIRFQQHDFLRPTPRANAIHCARRAASCETPSSPPRPKSQSRGRSAFRRGWQIPAAEYSAADSDDRNIVPARTSLHARAHESAIRPHQILPADSTTPTSRPPAASTSFSPA